MNQFKKIMAQSHMRNKECLHWLYDFWLEEVRSLDLVMAVGRLRKTINFCKTENEISNAVNYK